MESRTLGRYELLAELGKGAMGVVYRANDPLLDRLVAIKTVNMSFDPEEMAEYEGRFYQEAKAAGSLNHPNIVTIYDIGKSGNIAYMAMEFLQGEELRSLMSTGQPLPAARAVEISAQVAEGLAYAHHHGVVHRDIKPANIMLAVTGLAKITDFGIARMRSAEVKTQTGIVLGSPRYMSPEQVAGKRAEPRSDIFSLGVILYEMLTGKPPFTGEDVTSVMFQIMNLVPPPPSSINAQAPEILDFIVAKAIAKSVDDRYCERRGICQGPARSRQADRYHGTHSHRDAPAGAAEARHRRGPGPGAVASRHTPCRCRGHYAGRDPRARARPVQGVRLPERHHEARHQYRDGGATQGVLRQREVQAADRRRAGSARGGRRDTPEPGLERHGQDHLRGGRGGRDDRRCHHRLRLKFVSRE